MCGIFGYVGKEKTDLSGFLLDGLQKLEYRGYDSAGIAVFEKSGIFLSRAIGDVSNLAKKIGKRKVSGRVGIGHTRWATHGGVTVENAHPHLDCTGEIVAVHNGIVENFQELKKELQRKKHVFKSETDTEVIVHLIEEELKIHDQGGASGFLKAVQSSVKKLKGLSAIVVGSSKNNCLVAWRRGSPLSIGIDSGSYIVSSDLPILLSYVKEVVLLEEDEGVLLTSKQIVGFGKDGMVKKVKLTHMKATPQIDIQKGKFAHFMLKEIYEQPEVLGRIVSYPKTSITKAARLIENAYGTYFTACGTASYAGLAATYLFSHIAGRHVNFAVGSEFYFLEEFLKPKSLLIAASQSGETMDTLEAVRAAKRHGSKVISLVNVPGSTLSRMSDFSLDLLAGPEKAVASTKAYTATLAVFLLLSFALNGGIEEGFKLLRKTEKETRKLFRNVSRDAERIAKKILYAQRIFLIGRDVNYATALEGALKIKEVSYIHAEGFAGGELKHGVIALIEEGTPCIVFVANDRSRDSVLSNAIELKSRGAFIIGIGPDKEEVFDEFIEVPDVGFASPIVNVIPAQLLGYHLAVLKGIDPDKPRNLAKSVTVK